MNLSATLIIAIGLPICVVLNPVASILLLPYCLCGSLLLYAIVRIQSIIKETNFASTNNGLFAIHYISFAVFIIIWIFQYVLYVLREKNMNMGTETDKLDFRFEVVTAIHDIFNTLFNMFIIYLLTRFSDDIKKNDVEDSIL